MENSFVLAWKANFAPTTMLHSTGQTGRQFIGNIIFCSLLILLEKSLVPTTVLNDRLYYRSDKCKLYVCLYLWDHFDILLNISDVHPNVNDMYNPEQPSFDGRLPEKPPVWARLGAQSARHGAVSVQRNRELLPVMAAQTPPNVPTPGWYEYIMWLIFLR